jgi:hypothetical protein
MLGDPFFSITESPGRSQPESEKARKTADKKNAEIFHKRSGEIRIIMMAQNITPLFMLTDIIDVYWIFYL